MEISSAINGIGSIMGIRDYRFLWIGNTVSRAGGWVQRMALMWITWELTRSPSWLGTIAFFSLFPMALLAPFAGAVADRFGIRRTAIIANCICGGNSLVLATLALSDLINVEMILALTMIHSISSAFTTPAFNSLIPEIVPADYRSSAVAFNATSGHATAFIGPAIFGIILAALGIGMAFIFNAASFFILVYCLVSLNMNKEEIKKAPFTLLWDETIEGIRITLGHIGLMSLYFTQITMHLLLAPHRDLLAGFSDLVFLRGAEGYSMLAGASGIGALAGGMIMSFRGRISGLVRILNQSNLMGTIAILLFSLTSNFMFALVCLLFTGMAFVMNGVCMQTLLLNTTNISNRGRIMALSIILPVGLPAVGSIALGYLAEIFGLQIPMAGAAILGGINWFFASRQVRRVSELLEKTV
jgi:MFS family permease